MTLTCLDGEEWREIPGYEDLYAVSSLGRVKRITSNFILSPNLSHYPRVFLSKEGKVVVRYVHRLVAEAFLPNPKRKRCVNHRNGIKTDNRIENLEWSTHKENNRHADITGLWNHRGSSHTQAKLTEQDVRDIKESLRSGETHSGIAKRFHVCRQTVTNINNGTRWTHVR